MSTRRAVRAVTIVGAGPAGLAAAIELAGQGVAATVHEQRGEVGRRFHGDFQGLENWTTEEDVRAWLGGVGISPDFPNKPVHAIDLISARLERHRVSSDRPFLYLVRRGPQPDTLDRALRARAEELGVRLRFHSRVRGPTRGPTIWATGPRATQAVVSGIVARTSHPDQVVAIASDSLAPRCYAYCVVWNGRATVATALATRFREARQCFQRAREAFSHLGLRDFHHERPFGGRANIVLRRPLQRGDQLWVGEAAGLQDYLLGFGLRYAILSGQLAARALITGERYPRLVRRHIRPGFRAAIANRWLYNLAGDRGRGLLIRCVAQADDVTSLARRVYALTPVHRAVYPFAWLAAPKEP